MERDEPSRDSSGGHSKQLFYSCKLTFDTVLSSSTTRQQHQQSTFIYHMCMYKLLKLVVYHKYK
jgi:hypothetical protein